MDTEIEPWLLWIWNEQTFFFESADYTLNHSIEWGSQLCLIWCLYAMKFSFALFANGVNTIKCDHV
ncbi:MAG: hypothetical protein ACJAVI_001928 [Candidatus Azotimanducaceae bacterium]|jgi:hypothetical protein